MRILIGAPIGTVTRSAASTPISIIIRTIIGIPARAVRHSGKDSNEDSNKAKNKA